MIFSHDPIWNHGSMVIRENGEISTIPEWLGSQCPQIQKCITPAGYNILKMGLPIKTSMYFGDFPYLC